jgi:hypothetical protein
MIHAAGSGVTLALIGTEPGDRDPALSEATREAILAAVTSDEIAGREDGSAGDDRVANRAVALKAVLPETTGSRPASVPCSRSGSTGSQILPAERRVPLWNCLIRAIGMLSLSSVARVAGGLHNDCVPADDTLLEVQGATPYIYLGCPPADGGNLIPTTSCRSRMYCNQYCNRASTG